MLSTNSSKSSLPEVELSISATSTQFDLPSTQPFFLILRFVLRSEQPITFPAGSIFKHGTAFALQVGGLTFIDTETNTAAPRDQLTVCTFGLSEPELSPETQHAFITLIPRDVYVVEHQLGPIRSNNADISSPPLIEMLKWSGTRGLEDGRTYQVGVYDDTGILGWLYGTKDGILSEQKGWGFISRW